MQYITLNINKETTTTPSIGVLHKIYLLCRRKENKCFGLGSQCAKFDSITFDSSVNAT